MNTQNANIKSKLEILNNLVFCKFPENKDVDLIFQKIKDSGKLPIVYELGEDPGGFELSWINEIVHFDIEIHSNGNHEFYYYDKKENKSFCDDNNIDKAMFYFKKAIAKI